MSDNVNHPSHYTSGKIEVIDFIEDQRLPYHLGNVVKYVARAGRKDPTKTVEDLKKAEWYLHRYIESLENEETNPSHKMMSTRPVKGRNFCETCKYIDCADESCQDCLDCPLHCEYNKCVCYCLSIDNGDPCEHFEPRVVS